MKKFVLAPFLAALAMFMWGFVYWGLPHFLPYQGLQRVADDAAVGTELNKLFPVTGAYLLPSMALGEEKAGELMKRGPIAQVIITKEGMRPMDPVLMARGFGHMFVLALMLAIVLVRFENSFTNFASRVKFSAAIGLFVGVCHLGNAIWWHHPWGWTLATSIYDLVMFTLAGLVLAKFVAPKATAEAA